MFMTYFPSQPPRWWIVVGADLPGTLQLASGAKKALRQVCGAGVSPAWFDHNILGRRDARTTIIRKPGGEPQKKNGFSSIRGGVVAESRYVR